MVAPILFEGQIILGPTSKSRSSCFRALVVLFASVVALFALADAGAGEAAEPTTVFGASERCAPSRVRFLALEGGGVKGIAYAGAIGALEDAGVLQEVVGFSGSSAGSIIASFLAAGYSVSLERSESEPLQRETRNSQRHDSHAPVAAPVAALLPRALDREQNCASSYGTRTSKP